MRKCFCWHTIFLGFIYFDTEKIIITKFPQKILMSSFWTQNSLPWVCDVFSGSVQFVELLSIKLQRQTWTASVKFDRSWKLNYVFYHCMRFCTNSVEFCTKTIYACTHLFCYDNWYLTKIEIKKTLLIFFSFYSSNFSVHLHDLCGMGVKYKQFTVFKEK